MSVPDAGALSEFVVRVVVVRQRGGLENKLESGLRAGGFPYQSLVTGFSPTFRYAYTRLAIWRSSRCADMATIADVRHSARGELRLGQEEAVALPALRDAPPSHGPRLLLKSS